MTEEPKVSDRTKYLIWTLKDSKYHGYIELTSSVRETGVRIITGNGDYFGRIKDSREETIAYYKQLSETYVEYGGHYSMGFQYHMEEIFDLLYQEGLEGVREKYASFYQDHRLLLEFHHNMCLVYKANGNAVPRFI